MIVIKIKLLESKKGLWSCRFYFNNKRYFKALGTYNKAEAYGLADEFKQSVLRKERLGVNTLSTLIESYMNTQKELTTYAHYTYYCKVLLEGLGDIPLIDLTMDMCRDFYFNHVRKPSKRTGRMLTENAKRSYYLFFNSLMLFGMANGKIDNNPFKFFKNKQGPQYQRREREYTDLELELLSKALLNIKNDKNKLLVWRQMYYFFILMTATGARPKEILNIKWTDFSVVDEERVKFIIPADISKTKKMRRVDIPKWVYNELVGIQKLETYNSTTYVFDLKRRYHGVFGGKKWNTVCKIAGVMDGHIYDLRHTYISQRIRDGVNPVVLSEQVGHSSTKMTFDNYAHSNEADRIKLVDKVKKIG